MAMIGSTFVPLGFDGLVWANFSLGDFCPTSAICSLLSCEQASAEVMTGECTALLGTSSTLSKAIQFWLWPKLVAFWGGLRPDRRWVAGAVSSLHLLPVFAGSG